MSLVIGLTGRKRCGKDTVGKFLQTHHGAHMESFAKPIKEALSAMFRVNVGVFDDPHLKETQLPQLLGKSPRHLMQTLGTEWGRVHVQPDMCARLLHSRVTSLVLAQAGIVVITDVRFDNEAKMILDNGGEVWEVVRDKVLGPRDDSHRSEAGVSSSLVTLTIDNNGELDALYAQVSSALH